MQDVKLYTQNAPQYEGDCEYRISSIIKETLSPDRVNWGRIVTFVSFTKILLDKSIQDGRLDIAKQIIKELPIL